jgi:pyruvate,water dikinase
MTIQREFDYDMPEHAVSDKDLESYSVWMWDACHSMPAPTPLTVHHFCEYTSFAFQRAAEMLSIPESKGWEWKHLNGHVYVAVIEARPEEVPEREKLFRERMMPFIEDPVGGWARDRKEAWGLYKRIQEADIENVSSFELGELFYDSLYVMRRALEIHFEWMYPMYALDALFSTVAEELAGIKRDDPVHAKLRSGFDNILFKADKEIWLLGGKAAEMGLGDLFLTTEDNEELMSKLEASEAGREWLKGYRAFLDVYGWRCERMWDFSTPSWVEKPSVALTDVKRAVAKGGAHLLDAERERLAREREEAKKELVAKVPAEQKEWFKKLLGVAEISGAWSEEHTYYLDLPFNAVPGKVYREIGRRFARAGVIDEPFDVFFLTTQEIPRAIVPLERYSYHQQARKRKEDWRRVRTVPPPPFLGNVEKLGEVAMKDAVVGTVAAPPIVKPELKADLYGAASAPGVADGIARVVISETELGQVQPGEILVSPFTAAPWIPAFNIVKGVVTDMGGTMSHAVIVGREYALPVVAGTLEGTRKITTGMRIRVDGDMGTVYILEK